MSGPKCSQWEVEENLRRLERARLEALAEADAIIADIVRLVATVETARTTLGASKATSVRPTVDRPGRKDTLAEIERHAAVLRARRLSLQNEEASLAATARLAEIVAAASSLQESRARSRVATEQEKRDADIEMRLEDARRILARTPAAATAADIESLKRLAEAFVKAPSPGAARGSELELRLLMQNLGAADKARTRDLEEATRLRFELRGLEGSEVESVVLALTEVEAGRRPLDSALAVRASAVIGRARKASDRAYAMHVLRSEFEALGYEVGEDFATAFMHGGSLLVSRANGSSYAVEVAVSAQESSLDTRLVRVGDSAVPVTEQRLRDKEAEEAWCRDFAQILAGAGRSKVRARVTKRVAPGVEVVPAVAVAPSKAKKVRRAALKAHALGGG